MKKLVTAACALVAASAFAVESANTVGYQEVETSLTAGKYYMIGAQFEKVGATDAKTTFDDLIKLKNIAPGLYDDDFATAPQILVMKPNGAYVYYYYISDGTDLNDDPLGYDCWCDFDGYPLTAAEAQTLGNGFWLMVPVVSSGSAILINGQVNDSAERSVPLAYSNMYRMLSNPFPTPVCLADVSVTGLTPGLYDDDFATAPQILVMKPNGAYVYYYYISDGTDLNDDPLGYNCWCDFDGYPLDGENQIKGGACFWLKAPSTGALVFGI